MIGHLLEKEAEISKRLLDLGDPFSQMDYLMAKGLERKPVPEIRTDRHRIGGCKTAIWARAALSGDAVVFEADSDSLLVKGALSLFDELYGGAPVEEARQCPPRFLTCMADEVIYRDIKENGLRKCYERILSPEADTGRKERLVTK